jgi:hypothetical protein
MSGDGIRVIAFIGDGAMLVFCVSCGAFLFSAAPALRFCFYRVVLLFLCVGTKFTLVCELKIKLSSLSGTRAY